MPDQSAVVAREYEAPQDAIESALAAVWQELLGLDRIGRHDHFFELGGHSLMVISLIEKLRLRGLKADVRAVFTAPTLAAMAALMREAGAAEMAVLSQPDCPRQRDHHAGDAAAGGTDPAPDRRDRGQRAAGGSQYPGYLSAGAAAGRDPVPPHAANDGRHLSAALPAQF
ncbi:phosphopantetheine-binding protein [Massilia sp. H-1]|nr:phosphopantetheine-binding protein [Massilia sp. H-1]